MLSNSPLLRDMAEEPFGGKPLTFYTEVGKSSAVAATGEEFCVFSVESPSEVLRLSQLIGITELGPGKWRLSISEGPSVRSTDLLAGTPEFVRKLKYALEQLAKIRRRACPSEEPLQIVFYQEPREKPKDVTVIVLLLIAAFFLFGCWLFSPRSNGSRTVRNTEVGTPHTWPGYDTADHSNDCPKCGAKLSSRTDDHDCKALQRLNKSEGWIDGIYGGRRAQDL